MATQQKERSLAKRQKSDILLALLFAAPALIGLMVFVVWPGLRGIAPVLAPECGFIIELKAI